jgi:chromate transporter
MAGERPRDLRDLAKVFLRLGLLGFGGPAAVTAMMDEELVERRRWLTRQQFLDLVGATNLIPGPNATELAIHVGLLRAGWSGLLVAGLCFIVPGAAISGIFAWLYVRYGALPAVEPALAGIKPAVLSVIVAALLRLAQPALRTGPLALIGVAAAASVLAGMDEVAVLFGWALAGTLWLARPQPKQATLVLGWPAVFGLGGMGMPAVAAPAAAPTLWQLGLFFLKVGAVLYGSGYVLIAFIEGGLVTDRHWLTRQQLLDAVAVGQFTPGPFLSTVTFIGYLLGGVAGAIVATVAVFFPSFVFVLGLHRVLPRLRQSRWSAAFLDAVNAASLGLMAAVAVIMGFTVLTDSRSALIALLALALLLRWRWHAAVVIVACGFLGWAATVAR